MMRARTILRWLLGAFLLLVVLVLVAGVVVWMRLPSIAEHFGEQALREAGFTEPELKIASVSLGAVEMERLRIAQEGWSGTVENAVATFDPMMVWKERRLEAVSVGSVEATVEWPFLQRQIEAANAASESESDDATAGDEAIPFDLSAVPLDRVTIESLALTVEGPDWTETVHGRLAAELPSRDAFETTLSLQTDHKDSVQLEARWSEPEEAAQVALTVEVGDPLRWLDQLHPSWISLLPEAVAERPTVQGIGLEVDGVATAQGVFSGEARVRVDALEAALAETFGKGAIEALCGAIVVEENIPEVVDLDLGSVRWESAEAMIPAQTVHLTAFPEGTDLAAWTVSLAGPLAWQAPAADAAGKIDFEVNLRLPGSEFPGWVGGMMELSDLRWNEFATEPLTLDFEASPACAGLLVSSIVLVDQKPFRLQPTRFEAQQTAIDGGWDFWGSSAVPADAASGFLADWKHAALALDLSGSGNPETSALAVQGKLQSSTPAEGDAKLLAVPVLGITLAEGDWSLEFSAETADGASWQTELISSLSTDRLRVEPTSDMVFTIPALYFDAEGGGEGLTMDWIEAALADASRWPERLQLNFSTGADAIRGPAVDAAWPYFEGRTEGSKFKLSGYGGRINLVLGGGESEADSVGESEEATGTVEAEDAGPTERIVPIGQFSLETTVDIARENLVIDGMLGFGFAGAPGEIPFEASVKAWQTDDLRLAGALELEPLFLDYVDIFGRIFPALEGLSFTGTFAGAGDFSYDANGPEVSGRVDLTGAEISLPSSQLDLRGIEARVVLDSLRNFRTRPDSSYLEIDTVQAGDLAATDATVRFALAGLDTLSLEELRLNFFEGEVQLAPTRINLDAQTLESEIRFERLSLHRIGEQISVFDGTMAGVISGAMPFAIEQGSFQPREGFLRLPEGESAFLSLNADGLLSSKDAAEPTFSDKVLAWLGVQPEQLVEEALREIEVSELEVSLFPKDRPETPIHIQLGGKARAKDTVVPVHLETRINGTLTELYNFLIRMQALDAVSF